MCRCAPPPSIRTSVRHAITGRSAFRSVDSASQITSSLRARESRRAAWPYPSRIESVATCEHPMRQSKPTGPSAPNVMPMTARTRSDLS